MSIRRYCGMCEKWFGARHIDCPDCGAPTDRAEPPEGCGQSSCDDPGCPEHGVAASNTRQNEFYRNVAQRLQEWRTRREPISSVEARKRLLEAR